VTVAAGMAQEMVTGMAMMNSTLVVQVHLCRALPVCDFCIHLCCENTEGNGGKPMVGGGETKRNGILNLQILV